jgi:prepilin-type N-terminal cleavage/methylation domain-containing protein
MKPTNPQSPRITEEGFTLLELMVVVVIVGVLATLGVYGVANYLTSAKTSEAVSMMTSIKASEEAYKAETFTYLDVSTSFSAANFYPSVTVGKFKTQWGASSAVGDRWKTLGVQPDGPVLFTYAVVATPAGGAGPTLPTAKTAASMNLPSTPTAWQYIAVAKGAPSGSTRFTYVLSHSYSTAVYVENESN